MKCSGSQTICTAAERERPEVRTLEAVLFAKILEPLAKGLGPAGEITLASVAQRLFLPELR